MTTEFRKYGRSPLDGRVKLKHRELGEFYAEGGDISATGLFLKVDANRAMAIGDVLAAELPQHIPANELLGNARLRVVRVTDEGVGLAFV
jgi:hypothetical protein